GDDEPGRILDRDVFDPSADAPEQMTSTPLGTGAPLAMLHRLEGLRGYNPLHKLRFKEYLQFVSGADRPLQPLDRPLTFPVTSTVPAVDKKLLDLLGVRYVLQPSDRRLGPEGPEAEAATAALGGVVPALAPGLHDGLEETATDPRPAAYDFVAGGI